MDFLKEVYETLGETLTISAAWLNPPAKIDKKTDISEKYSLALSVQFNQADIQTLKGLLLRRKLEMKKENEIWVISKATF